jgi:hypothetical protein
VIIDLNEEEVAMLWDALDSHLYWQLSDSHFRRDGYVLAPVADSPIDGAERRAEALCVDALMGKLGNHCFDDVERECVETGLRDDPE